MTEYQPTTSWTPGELAADEQQHEEFRHGFALLTQACEAAVASGRPHAIIVRDVAASLQWMNPYQALTMLAAVAVDTAARTTPPRRPA
ncbi:MAG: hypothetical protein V4510_12040 [bacterium]